MQFVISKDGRVKITALQRTFRYFCLVYFFILTSSQLFSQSKTAVIDDAPDTIALIHAPFIMPQLSRPVFNDTKYDVRKFGAKEGGTVKNTEAIQNAIDAAARAGGGTIVIPEGIWLTGAIHLEDGINLHLVKGAELLFSQDPKDYLPAVFSRHEDIECYKFSSFIYAQGKTNIGITGEGVLNGQGKPWWEWKKSQKKSDALLRKMADTNLPVKERVFDGSNGYFLRPAFFQPMNCKNVFVEGVTFLYGAFWTITPTYCDNVIVRKVKIETYGNYGHTPNGDGVDPSSCKNVLIEYCEFATGDDCIAIKSGRDKDGLRVNLPTENVVVRNCFGKQGHGGIVIGSETSGGIRNIYAYDCAFNGTDRIVRIKTARGRGGIIENMWFRSLSADTIEQEALRINMLYEGSRFPVEPVTQATPVIRNIHYSNINCAYSKSAAIEIIGIPEMPVENISFDSVSIHSSKGFACTDVHNIRLENVALYQESGPVINVIDGSDIAIDRLKFDSAHGPLLYIDGQKSSGIFLTNTDISGVKNAVQYGEHVSPNAVTIK